MQKKKTRIWVVLCTLLFAAFALPAKADAPDSFFETTHNILFFNKIEEISKINAACFSASGARPYSTIFPLSEILTGNFDEAIRKMEVLYESHYRSYDVEAQFCFLQVYGWVLAQHSQTENALDLWKTFLKSTPKALFQQRAKTEIGRIYNQWDKPLKALLFLTSADGQSLSDTRPELMLEASVEKCRSFFLLADTLKAGEQLDQTLFWLQHSPQLAFTDQLMLLNLMLLLNSASTSDYFNAIENQIDNQPFIIQSIAYRLLSHQINLTPDEAYHFAAQSKLAIEQHRLCLAEAHLFPKSESGRPEEANSPGKSWKEVSKSLVIFTLLAAFIVIVLIVLVLKSYFHFIRTIHLKSEQILQHRREDEALMHESFHKIDELVGQREANLQKELLERDKVDTELNDALRQTETANFAKNAFLSNLSHEIRTPLNGIIGFSNLLENELALRDQPELFDYANSIQRSGEKLLHLLNNIIDISRLEANDFELSPTTFYVKDIVEETLRQFAPSATEKGIRMVSEMSDFCAYADPEILSRVIYEILDNAVKFTEKGFIRLKVSNDTDPLYVQITIKDTGIGIDPNYFPGLLEAYRSESSGYSRQYQGAALGIPLSKQLVERMNGKFFIESQKAVGTTVNILLPLSESPKIKPEVQQNEPELLLPQLKNLFSNQQILIIEGEQSLRNTLTDYLEPIAKVQAASNGDEAMNIIKKEATNNNFFRLIISEVHLQPPWDGLKLVQTIRSGYLAYHQAKALGLTTFELSAKANSSKNDDFNAYLHKPIEKKELYKLIIEMFSPGDSKDDLESRTR